MSYALAACQSAVLHYSSQCRQLVNATPQLSVSALRSEKRHLKLPQIYMRLFTYMPHLLLLEPWDQMLELEVVVVIRSPQL
jgi:hypothetical protein